MKAILINETGVYSKHNGHTFKVNRLLPGQAELNINGVSVDVPFRNILIVDLADELETALDDLNVGHDTQTYPALKSYCKQHIIVS